MLQWVQLHSDGAGVNEAAEEAVRSVMTGEGASLLSPWCLLQWLRDYVFAGGRILLSQRGHHTKTESYLDDPDTKLAAVLWLRQNVQASRKKPVTNRAMPIDRHQGQLTNRETRLGILRAAAFAAGTMLTEARLRHD